MRTLVTNTYTTDAGYAKLSPVERGWNHIMNLFIWGGEDSDTEIALEVPDDAEETDLKRHATRCALRYRSLKGAIGSLGRAQRRIEIIILVVGVWIIATSPEFRDILKSLLGL